MATYETLKAAYERALASVEMGKKQQSWLAMQNQPGQITIWVSGAGSVGVPAELHDRAAQLIADILESNKQLAESAGKKLAAVEELLKGD